MAQTPCADGATLGDGPRAVPRGRPHRHELPDFGLIQPFTVAVISESVEAIIEELDAPRAAAPALLDGLEAADPEAGGVPMRSDSREERELASAGVSEGEAISVDEYAKAVLYNGLGHYQAACAAARRACERDDFVLLVGALAELVEASVRSGSPADAVAAFRRLEARTQGRGSEWAMGIAACASALIGDDQRAEASYLEAIQRLGSSRAHVASGRVRLLYGEWLRRRGRRVDAREQLALAHRVFNEVGLSGFAERARRELLATGETVRKRSDDTRRELTPQESQIAQLAAHGYTNSEIGQQLFISPRTVEWHLRKVFTKSGINSRRELSAIFPRAPYIDVSA